MNFRRVGTSGLQVSEVGLGCNNFGSRLDFESSKELVEVALDEGITFFDTADIYGGGVSEEYLGRAVGNNRDSVVIATKFGLPMSDGPYGSGACRRYIVRSCESSLRRLNTDHIDVYFQHIWDPATPIDETLEALDDLVEAGKVLYVGSSNFTAWQIVEAHYVGRDQGTSPFIATQCHWNLLTRDVEAELVPACEHLGVAVIPYFPLASGLLTGKYRANAPYPPGSRLADHPFYRTVATDENLTKVERLRSCLDAMDGDLSMLGLSVSWLASHASVPCVITGAMTTEQLRANVGSIVALDDELLRGVEDALAGV